MATKTVPAASNAARGKASNKKPKQGLTSKQAGALWANLKRAPPLLTDEEVHTIEQSLSDRSLNGIPRRAVLSMATEGGGELIRKVESDRAYAVIAAALMVAGEAWLERSKCLNELIEAQVLRNRMALCNRDDMDDVIREGEAMLESAPD